MSEIVIRDFNMMTDGNFVFSSWIKSFYGKSPTSLFVPEWEYKDKQSKLIAKLLELSTTKVAVNASDANVLVAYAVFQKEINTLHYVYVKELFRGFGICRKLLLEAAAQRGTRVTHLTMRGKTMSERRGYIYSPYFDLKS